MSPRQDLLFDGSTTDRIPGRETSDLGSWIHPATGMVRVRTRTIGHRVSQESPLGTRTYPPPRVCLSPST